MKTALYVRTSTSTQATGLEAQVRALESYCALHGITEYEVFSDSGISGTKAHRPALDRMMAEVERGGLSTIAVYSLSRLARSTRNLLSTVEVLRSHKVNFVSLSESLDTSNATGRAVLTIISAIAQLESELTVERIKSGLNNCRAKGIKLGRKKTRNTALILELLDQGLTYKKISALVKCSAGSIRAVVKERSQISMMIDTEQKRSLA